MTDPSPSGAPGPVSWTEYIAPAAVVLLVLGLAIWMIAYHVHSARQRPPEHPPAFAPQLELPADRARLPQPRTGPGKR